MKLGHTLLSSLSHASAELIKQIGSAGMGVPTYLYLRNARPIRPIGVRMMVAGGMGMIGSFLGFTAGGVAAAMEVNRRMENPQERV